MKDENSPYLVPIKYSMDTPHGSITARQINVYSKKIRNVTKCTVGLPPWAMLPNKLPCGTYVCHSMGEHCETSVLDYFL